MKVSCHEEIFFGCRDVELLKVLFLDFWRMVNHQTRLPFGEYFVLIFANYQTCKSTTIMSWIQHQVRIERRSSINLCKFGAMRYSPPTPKKNHSPISSSSAGGELLALFVWLPIVKFRQDFHQQYLHVVGMEKAENSSWQLDWVRLLHLNKSYGKKIFNPKNISSEFQIPPRKLLDFVKKNCQEDALRWRLDKRWSFKCAIPLQREKAVGPFCGFGVFGAVFLGIATDLGVKSL